MPIDDLEGDGSESDPYVVTTVAELQAIDDVPAAHVVLGAVIDASETETWTREGRFDDGFGLEPIGDEETAFSGTLDGRGHAISGLTIVPPGPNPAGLFAIVASDGTVEDVVLEDVRVGGASLTGAIAAVNRGEIRDVRVTGTVSGGNRTGGIVGRNDGGTVSDSTVDATVAGPFDTGGVAGVGEGGAIRGVEVAGTVRFHGEEDRSVTHGEGIGGVVGRNDDGPVRDATVTAAVDGVSDVGGVVGENETGSIERCTTTGTVTGDDGVGGVVGSDRDGSVLESVAEVPGPGLVGTLAALSGFSSLWARRRSRDGDATEGTDG